MAAEDIDQRIDAALVARIVALNLTSAVAENSIGAKVQSQIWLDFRDGNPVPAARVTRQGLIETMAYQDSASKVWRRPRFVWIVDRSEDRNAKGNLYSEWRKILVAHFEAKPTWELIRAATVPELSGIEVQPAVVYDPDNPAYQTARSAIQLNLLTTEDR